MSDELFDKRRQMLLTMLASAAERLLRSDAPPDALVLHTQLRHSGIYSYFNGRGWVVELTDNLSTRLLQAIGDTEPDELSDEQRLQVRDAFEIVAKPIIEVDEIALLKNYSDFVSLNREYLEQWRRLAKALGETPTITINCR
jgi:hypothetical protein